MKRKTLKKALSAFLSLLMCMMTLLSISTPVFAATTVDAYMVDFPRDGDSNYENTGLPGAVFDIAAAEDIYTPDGTFACKGRRHRRHRHHAIGRHGRQ